MWLAMRATTPVPIVEADDFTLSVDGPYGTPMNFTDFSRVVLIAGGIGVTPCVSIFNSLKGKLQAGLGFYSNPHRRNKAD